MINYPDSARADIIRAVQLLANVDDGAHRTDAQGFNQADTSFGQHLASLPAEAWSEKSYYTAWKLIGKYHHQLKRLGMDIYTIPKPDEPKPVRALTVAGDRLAFKFDYDARIVGALKEVFRERRWDDKNKQWLVNAPLMLARSFAAQHNFQIDSSVSAWVYANGAHERRVEQHGEELRFYFPYNLVTKDDLKTAIPSAKFKNTAGAPYWYAPFSTSESKNILEYATKYAFHMDDVLRAALAAEVEKVERNVEASKAHSAELEIKGLQKTLRPFQKAGVKYAMENERVWIADQMGLGKTIQSIAALHVLNAYPTLIVVPASLKLNWQREIFAWMPPHIDCTILSGSKGKTPPKNIQVVIINYDILPGWLEVLSQIEWKAIICDESQYLKNGKAKRTKAVKQMATGVNEDGDLVMSPIPYRFLLSGTPIMNRPAELVPQLEILGRINEFGGGFKFLKRYAGAERTRFGWDMSGAAHLDELNQKMRGGGMYIRRLKSEVLTELPDKTRVLVPMELDNRREYEKAQADVIEYLRTAKPIVVTPPQGLTLEGFKKLQWGYSSKMDDNAKRGYLRSLDVAKEMDENTFARFAEAFAEAVHAEARQRGREQAEHLIRFEALKQLAAQGKMDGIKEWVSNFLDTGEKLVLFAHHKEIVKLLSAEFKAPSITGDTSLKARDEAVQRFQNDGECRLIVCNIKAGGIGLTLTAASNVAFIELEWTTAAHSQAADRVHRIGQKNAVTEWYLLAERSIDTEIWDLLDAKRVIVDATTEGGKNFEDEAQQMEFSVMNELKDRMKAK